MSPQILLRLLLAMAIVAVSAVHAQSPQEVILVQISDSHQILEPGESGSVSLARAVTKIREIRAQDPQARVMVVHSGDFLAPSPSSRTLKGRDMVQALAAAGVEVAAVGNHEFDYNTSVLIQRAGESAFPFVAANITNRAGQALPHIPPYVVKEAGGIRIAFVGMTTAEQTMATIAKFGDDCVVSDPTEAMARTVADIRAHNRADMVVALTHLYKKEDEAILNAVPGIDLALGGHEHTAFQGVVNGVPLIKVRNDLQDISVVRIQTTPAGRTIHGEIIALTREIAADPAMERLMDGIRAQISVANETVVATLNHGVDTTRKNLGAQSRTGSADAGTWVVGLFTEAMGGDAGFMNLGIVARANAVFQPGPLTVGHVDAIFPWEDPPVLIETTGAVVRRKFEEMISKALLDMKDKNWSGKFPIVSGFDVAWDLTLPEGQRLTRLDYRGATLADDQSVRVMVNLYLYNSDAALRAARLITGPTRTEYEVLTGAIRARYGQALPSTSVSTCEEMMRPASSKE